MENKIWKYLPKKNQWIVVLLVGILLVIIAIPTKTNTNSLAETKKQTTEENVTELEKRLAVMLQNIPSVGKVDVMITFRDEEQVEGILVLAEGAGDAVIVRNITDIVQALFDVEMHKIKVIERNSIN